MALELLFGLFNVVLAIVRQFLANLDRDHDSGSGIKKDSAAGLCSVIFILQDNFKLIIMNSYLVEIEDNFEERG